MSSLIRLQQVCFYLKGSHQTSVLLNFSQDSEDVDSVVFGHEEPVVDEVVVAVKVLGEVEVWRVDGLEQGLGVVVHDGLVDALDRSHAAEVAVVGRVHLLSGATKYWSFRSYLKRFLHVLFSFQKHANRS